MTKIKFSKTLHHSYSVGCVFSPFSINSTLKKKYVFTNAFLCVFLPGIFTGILVDIYVDAVTDACWWLMYWKEPEKTKTSLIVGSQMTLASAAE